MEAIIGGLGGGGSAAPGKADGGLIDGPGGPRDDRILIRASAGEFVVNAAATARNLPLLEALNEGEGLGEYLRGAVPGRADGGPVGAAMAVISPAMWGLPPAPSRAAPAAAGGDGRIEVGVRLYWDRRRGDWAAEMERIARAEAGAAVGEGISTFSDRVLPHRLREIEANPRMVG